MKRIPPLSLIFMLLFMHNAQAQISDSDRAHVQKNQEFFESSVVGNTYTYKDQDSSTVQLTIGPDSIMVYDNAINDTPTLYRYNARFSTGDQFTLELFQGDGVFIRLYCQLASKNNGHSFFMHASDKLYLNREENWVVENGLLLVEEE